MLADTNGYTTMYNFKKAKGYQDMGKQFNAYLANFLKSRNPNSDKLVKWNNWTTKNKLSQVFDANATKATVESRDTSTTS